MDANNNAILTKGRKGLVYDWRSMLVPDEPQFSEELDELIFDDSVVTERN